MNLYLENTGKGILITFLLLIGSMLNNKKEEYLIANSFSGY
jgi:hypothetical protein